jgi:cytidyltransferase-like protein
VKKLGILAGAFNPLTRAHLALAEAAAQHVDEVICAVPRAYPHKEFHGAALEDRVEMLRAAGCRAAVTEKGLFIDIARQLREPDTEIFFICGRDAAERIIGWDYGEAGAIERMMDEFALLVADRDGTYRPPPHLSHRVHSLQLPRDYSDVSSTEVRRRIGAGEPWEHLVPEAIAGRVRAIYAA